MVEHVRVLGYKLVAVSPTPREGNELGIENLNELLIYSIQGNMPAEQERPSSHTQVKKVVGTNVTKMSLSDNKIEDGGNGVLSFSRQYGSDHEDKADELDQEGFTFEFDVTLGCDQQQKLRIESVERIKVDYSYYI